MGSGINFFIVELMEYVLHIFKTCTKELNQNMHLCFSSVFLIVKFVYDNGENEKFIPVFVFVIYINDSEDYLLDRNPTGPSTITEGIKMKMWTREYMCFRGNLIRHNANDSVACARAPGP